MNRIRSILTTHAEAIITAGLLLLLALAVFLAARAPIGGAP